MEPSIIESITSQRVASLFAEPWLAVRTRSRFEHVVATELEKKGIESFLPLRRVIRRWSDRRKLIDEPLFRGYVFLRAPEESRLRALRTAGVVSFVGQSAADPWEVPEPEMQALQRFVAERLRIDPFPYLKAGQRVYVRSGPLRGIEGFIVRKNSRCRLVVSVEMMMQSVAVEVDESSVEPLY